MKRRSAYLRVVFLSALLRMFFGGAHAEAILFTNPPVASSVVATNIGARAMKFEPLSGRLFVLSSNNVVSLRDPATLEADRAFTPSFTAVDLAVSEDHSVLYLFATGNVSSVIPIRLDNFQSLDPIPIAAEKPAEIESLPGATNGFVVTTGSSVRNARVILNGTNAYQVGGITAMVRSSTNVMLFDTNRFRYDFHVEADGSLSAQSAPDQSVFWPGSSLNADFTSYYTVNSQIVDGPRALLFCGYSNGSIQMLVDDPHHEFFIPPVTINLPGPPADPVRWGADGVAVLGAGSVISFRSGIVASSISDIAISQQGLSGITEQSSACTITVFNKGPAPATDVRIKFQPPYPSVLPYFSDITNVVVSKGRAEIHTFKYSMAWYLPRLEPGESATATVFSETPGLGATSYKLSAVANEIDPTPDDSFAVAEYDLAADPAKFDYLNVVTGGVLGGSVSGSAYVPQLDEVFDLSLGVIRAQNLHTGLSHVHATIQTGTLTRIFPNDENGSTFLVADDHYTLYRAATMQPLWSIERGYSVDFRVADNVRPVSVLIYSGATTNIVVAGEPPVYPLTTNQLLLYSGGLVTTNKLEGGNQLIRSGPASFLSYIGGKGVLQSFDIVSNRLVRTGAWSNLFAGREIDLKNNVLYSADGRTYAFPSMQAGTAFAGIQNPESVRVLPQIDRAVFLMTGKVAVYELSSRQLLGGITSTNFKWNYTYIPRNIDFSPPDMLYFSSTTEPVLMRSSLLRGLELSFARPNNQALKLGFFARTGKHYILQSSAEVANPAWNTEEELNGANATIERTYNVAPATRFFRILQQ